MIIVKFYSGIGNQLYQYAVYELLKEIYPSAEIKADLSSFYNHDVLNGGNGFSYGFGLRGVFGVNVPVASYKEIKKLNYNCVPDKYIVDHFPKLAKKMVESRRYSAIRGLVSKKVREKKKTYITNVPANAYNGCLFELDNNTDYFIDGLWQNYEYIKPVEDNLRKTLNFKYNESKLGSRFLERIRKSNSILVHVRRGDFTAPENKFSHELCDKEYYRKAINFIKEKVENPVFFIFSDDIGYCKKKFGDKENIIYVSGGKDISIGEEMSLMSECKHAIISNSTFAFWTVWLGDNYQKHIICPKYVTRIKERWDEFSVPEHWEKIDNLTHKYDIGGKE